MIPLITMIPVRENRVLSLKFTHIYIYNVCIYIDIYPPVIKRGNGKSTVSWTIFPLKPPLKKRNVSHVDDRRLCIPICSNVSLTHTHMYNIRNHDATVMHLSKLYIYTCVCDILGMDQYLLIPFLGGWTSINPGYFDVNYRGTIGFDTLPYLYIYMCVCGWWFGTFIFPNNWDDDPIWLIF